MKKLARLLLWVAGGLFAIVLGLTAQEAVLYVGSNEATARDQAKQEFLRECAGRGVNPSEFKGPQRIKSPPSTYGFVWASTSNGDQIATMVSYMPWGVDAWLVPDQQRAKFAPYCDQKELGCH
ncbi:hypothetical protein [Bradyrhizobium archetypum]|uniref:Uncharacterized protein n=1 Tax=Bradyrhizobium archetypum TaxID=2721160 RepID=A0A7Y4H524_9BRAD|nr:hypothetical protein [Bradyrhizobium archetypum]NOJ47800.1 hypothetical protein [Bradyrhizobium archetypum]